MCICVYTYVLGTYSHNVVNELKSFHYYSDNVVLNVACLQVMYIDYDFFSLKSLHISSYITSSTTLPRVGPYETRAINSYIYTTCTYVHVMVRY